LGKFWWGAGSVLVQDVTECSSVFLQKEKGKMAVLLVPSMPGLLWLVCAIKSCFKVLSLTFMCTLCVGGNLVGHDSEVFL
jgi:hypothetical protein